MALGLRLVPHDPTSVAFRNRTRAQRESRTRSTARMEAGVSVLLEVLAGSYSRNGGWSLVFRTAVAKHLAPVTDYTNSVRLIRGLYDGAVAAPVRLDQSGDEVTQLRRVAGLDEISLGAGIDGLVAIDFVGGGGVKENWSGFIKLTYLPAKIQS